MAKDLDLWEDVSGSQQRKMAVGGE